MVEFNARAEPRKWPARAPFLHNPFEAWAPAARVVTMRLPALKIFAAAVPLFALAACASGKAQRRNVATTPVPGWLERVPVVEGKVYAIGSSGPTFWPQDALNNAAEDARGKLAISLQSKMEILTKRADRGSDGTHVDLVKAATDMVVQNSRVEATWVDAGGERGEQGGVWALAYIEAGTAKLFGKGQAVESSAQVGVPAWLDRLPHQEGRIYAYGYSGPTFRPEDAKDYAGDDAAENLAKALRSHVQAYQLLVENNTGLSVDEFSRSERPDDDFRELVKKKAKVETTWIDQKGIRPGYPAGSVWSLAWVDVSSTKGGYQQVANEATGPALTNTGEVDPGADRKDAPRPVAPAAAPSLATQSAPTPVQPASATLPQPRRATPADVRAPAGLSSPSAQPRTESSGKLAPYPSEGERCKTGYESTGGWCLPAGE